MSRRILGRIQATIPCSITRHRWCCDRSLTPWLVHRGCMTCEREGLLPLSPPQTLVRPAAPAGSSAACLLGSVRSLMSDSQHRKLSLSVSPVSVVLLLTSLPRSPSDYHGPTEEATSQASVPANSSTARLSGQTVHGCTERRCREA